MFVVLEKGITIPPPTAGIATCFCRCIGTNLSYEDFLENFFSFSAATLECLQANLQHARSIITSFTYCDSIHSLLVP